MAERPLDARQRTDDVATAASLATLRRRWRPLVAVAAALTALLPVGAAVLVNAPVSLPIDLAAATGQLGTVATLGPGVAAVAFGVTAGDDVAGIGLLFVGVFGVLAGLVPSATVAAAVALPVGAAVAVGARWRRRDGPVGDPHLLVGLVLLAGVVLTLAGAFGVGAGGLRWSGAHLALVGLGSTPVLVPTATRDWVVGGVAVAAVLTAAAVAPFVLGAVLLVSLDVVGPSAVVVAAGLGGLAITASATVRHRRSVQAAGVGLLLAGGVPASIPSALAVTLGAVFLTGAAGGGPE